MKLWRQVSLAAKLPACVVAMEACCGRSSSGAGFAAHDREVRLMSSEYVSFYVKAQKNDDRDAEGIAGGGDAADHALCGAETQDRLDIQTCTGLAAGWSANGRR
jgi:transposase